jgi:hypothetical protein
MFEYLKGSILENIIDLEDSIELVVNNLDLDKYFELKYDFVNQVQLVQKLINESMIIEANYIINYMVKNF